MSEEYDIKNVKKAKENEIKYQISTLSNMQKKLADIKRNPLATEEQLKEANENVNRWKYVVNELQLENKFIRSNSKEDIEYRDRQCAEFPKKLLEALPKDMDIRFHGTPIYFAKQIIESGMISSSADRFDGYIKSTDMTGEISASKPEDISRTLDFFSGMSSYMRCLPAGCVFAIKPRDEEDANYGNSLLHSVDFKKNPNQLYGIFTTPENESIVKSWLQKEGFNENLVTTFDGFLQAIQKDENRDNIAGSTKEVYDESKSKQNSNLPDRISLFSKIINTVRTKLFSKKENLNINQEVEKNDGETEKKYPWSLNKKEKDYANSRDEKIVDKQNQISQKNSQEKDDEDIIK